MTECLYDGNQDFIQEGVTKRQPYFVIDLSGENAVGELDRVNEELGLAFDDSDKAYYLDFFRSINRSPTDVELFDLAQCNSEHSRHWFFRGRIFVNGVERKESLFKSVQNTQLNSNANNVIAFCDNSR
jgi:phosphoribosylformylglycinamidine synthase